jgi:hypothetical protein
VVSRATAPMSLVSCMLSVEVIFNESGDGSQE